MDEKEIKFKKFWFATFTAVSVSNLLFSLLKTNETFQENNIPQLMTSLTLLYATITTILFIVATYYCAYKKPGTKLLTFMLVSYPLGVILTIILAILGKIPTSFQSFSAIIITVLQQIAALWMLTLNWKMRKLNMKLKQVASQ
jgi:hypothetical protein